MVTTYSISGYSHMIADKGRMDAYVEALRRVVRPGSIVLDIGAGTGILSLQACKFGAEKIYAVEPSDAIQTAKEIAAANGYGERIEFIQKVSTEIALPQPADVIVSDLRGVVPLFQHHIPSIVDARKRLLAPGGALIPQRDAMWIAVAETADVYLGCCEPWSDNDYGFDMQAARKRLVNSWYKEKINPEHLLAKPQRLGELDYNTIEDANIGAEIEWSIERAGTAHGLVVWFDAVLTEGVGFSNAPGEPELIYGRAFFPMIEPIELTRGDVVTVSMHADLVGDDYVWRWDTRVLARGNPGQIKADFKQSTFYGAVMSPAHLRKISDGYKPVLNEDGEIDRLILMLMSQETSLGEIARQVSERFSSRFPGWKDALTRIGALSEKYSK